MASFGVDCNTADGDTLCSRNEANEFAGGMFIFANATISTSSYPILGLNEVSQRTDKQTLGTHRGGDACDNICCLCCCVCFCVLILHCNYACERVSSACVNGAIP